jgi:ElaB/YqjD/DUF883 family membrane-anchored ribosome-binding protein
MFSGELTRFLSFLYISRQYCASFLDIEYAKFGHRLFQQFTSPTEVTMYSATTDAKNAANAVKNDVQDGAAKVKGDIREVANKVGRDIRGFIDTANDEIHKVGETVSDQIKANPRQSALIAVGVGFVLGFLFRR